MSEKRKEEMTDVTTKPSRAITLYRITARPVRYWDDKSKEWKENPPYTSAYPIFGVKVVNGQAETTSRSAAVEFADMGYQVEPNPKRPRPEEPAKIREEQE